MGFTLPTSISATQFAVATHSLAKGYGSKLALTNLSLQVPLGRVYLLVGPNGAGKTTAIKVLLHAVRSDGGYAEVCGVNVTAEPALARANIGYVPEQQSWGYGWMRVEELLRHHAMYYPTWDGEYERTLTSLFEVPLGARLRDLSKGQARRVHWILALGHRPPLVILDEPTDGFDPLMREQAFRILASHVADTPTAVLLSTHHVAEVEDVVEVVGVMSHGRLICQAEARQIRQNVRRYGLMLPASVKVIESVVPSVIKVVHAETHLELTAWGPEANIIEALGAAGIGVKSVDTMSLNESTLAMLNGEMQ